MPGRDKRSPTDMIGNAVDAYQQQLVRYATRMLGNQTSAAEVVQESFARLQEEVTTKGPPQNSRAWLYRVVRNLSIDQLRRMSRFSTPDDPNWMARLVTSADSGGDPSILAQKKEEQTMVLESLDQLPSRQREAVRLKFQEGLTYAEIGQVTEQPITTVGRLLHEALATLRKRLATVQ